jgi:hypothetical protein
MRLVPILPLDIETRTRAEVDLYRLRVCHDFKYRIARATAPSAQNLVKPPDSSNLTQSTDSIPNIFFRIPGIYPSEPVILVLRDKNSDEKIRQSS